MRIIDFNTYHDDMHIILKEIQKNLFYEQFDCIVALKRSGWILGVFLSNKLTLPVFTPSEINSIPEKFKRILIVDDTICKGKSIRKVSNQFKDKRVRWAAMNIEGDYFPEYFV